MDRRSSGARRNEFAGLAFRDAIRERMIFQEIPTLTFGSISFRNRGLRWRVTDLRNQSLL